jgi:hypothetical protein
MRKNTDILDHSKRLTSAKDNSHVNTYQLDYRRRLLVSARDYIQKRTFTI